MLLVVLECLYGGRLNDLAKGLLEFGFGFLCLKFRVVVGRRSWLTAHELILIPILFSLSFATLLVAIIMRVATCGQVIVEVVRVLLLVIGPV